MDKEILKMLVCPACKSALDFVENKIVCTACGRVYPIEEGIPVLLVDETEVTDEEKTKRKKI